MTVKFHYFLLEVWVPNENFEVEATRNDYLVFLTIGDFTNGLIMSGESFYWLFSVVF